MALSIQVDVEVYPPDAEVAIEGVGRFMNGARSGIEITAAQEETYYIINGRVLDDTQAGVSVTGTPEYTPPESPEDIGAATTSEPEPEPQPEPPPEPEGDE